MWAARCTLLPFVIATALPACQGPELSRSQSALPAAPAEAPAAAPAAGPAASARPGIDWSAAPDCRSKLRLLQQAAANGRIGPDHKVPIVVVAGARAGRSWLRPSDDDLIGDLPLPTVATEHDPSARAAPCLIRVGPAYGLKAAHHTIDQESVESEYQRRVALVRNPEYDVAKARLKQAERRDKLTGDGDLILTGDPTFDLIGMALGGLLTGFAEAGQEDEVDAALDKLAETPVKVEQPVYEPYVFERVTVLARKRAEIPIAIEDRDRGQISRVTLRQREEREFAILTGLHRKDRFHDQHKAESISRRDLQRWKRRPPPMRLSAVIEALLDGAPDLGSAAPRQAQTVNAFEPESAKAAWDRSRDDRTLFEEGDGHARWRADLAARKLPDQRLASVVRVERGSGGHGSGFYVAPDLIVTSYQTVKDQTVLDLVSADGQRVPGLVVRGDPARDLALVQTPKPGPPVRLNDGGSLSPGSQVNAIAYARGHDFALSRGVVSAVRKRPSHQTPGLQDVLYIQTDAPMNAGSSGGPLFQDDVVVGVSSWGSRGPKDQGSNFAVHADEVITFLKQDQDASW